MIIMIALRVLFFLLHSFLKVLEAISEYIPNVHCHMITRRDTAALALCLRHPAKTAAGLLTCGVVVHFLLLTNRRVFYLL